jgi:hypothetical protein
MENITVDLNSQSQPLSDIIISSKFKGFKFRKYLITVHHGNPIDKITFDSEPVGIYINSSWNELLILECPIYEVYPIKKIKNNIPKYGEVLFLTYDKFKRIELTVDSFEFINLNNFPTNPRVTYIKATMTEYRDLESLSGSPILNSEEKLVGIFCKQGPENSVYILPSYYIKKTLEKKDNNSIYNIYYEDQVKRINKSEVVDRYIYHRSLKIRIPLDCYFLLEGDERKELTINNEIKETYVKIDEHLPITNERDILYEMNKIVVTTSVLILFKNINKDSIIDIINFIKINLGKKIYLAVDKRNIQEKNKIIKHIEINNMTYKFIFFTI